MSSCIQTGAPTDFASLICKITGIVNLLIPLIIALTVLVFLWGIFQFVIAGDNEEKRKEGRALIIYGIISLFVMVSVWGLVNILTGTFFNGALIIPQLR